MSQNQYEIAILFSYSTLLGSMSITSERAALKPLVGNVKKCVFKHAKDEQETDCDHL